MISIQIPSIFPREMKIHELKRKLPSLCSLFGMNSFFAILKVTLVDALVVNVIKKHLVSMVRSWKKGKDRLQERSVAQCRLI